MIDSVLVEDNRMTLDALSVLWIQLVEDEATNFLISQAIESKENSRLIQDFIDLYKHASTIKEFRFAVNTKIYHSIGNSGNAEIEKINTSRKIANAIIALGGKQ